MTTTTESAPGADEFDSRSSVSRESSFYGGKAIQRKYERAVDTYDDHEYWRVHDWNVQVIAARAVKRQTGQARQNAFRGQSEQSPQSTRKRKRSDGATTKDDYAKEPKTADNKDEVKSTEKRAEPTTDTAPEPERPYNPYEGKDDAMQLDETADSFLARLKPSTTDLAKPYLWVANVHSKRALTGDIASFRQIATNALDGYMAKKNDLSKLSEQAITRKLRPDRVALEAQINEAAKKYSVVHGKWMLFPHVSKVDWVWETVVRATVEGRLGCSAKVATRMDQSEEDGRLLCVYTDDCFDRDDVKRVLGEMKALGLVDLTSQEGGRSAIYYKCDAYTYLDIRSGNEYKLKASMYSSKDLLEEMKTNKEI